MVKSIDSLARGLHVVEAIRQHSPVSLAELHHQTGISKATLLRVLKTLQEAGWVYRALGDSCYRLSFTLNRNLADNDPGEQLAELAAPIIQELQSELRWPVDIAMRDGLAMKIVESTRLHSVFILNRQVMGYRPPFLMSGNGRAYLAFCPEEERRSIINALKASKTKEGRLACDTVWLQQLLEQTRRQGYGERESSYFGVGTTEGEQIAAIAVPVMDKQGVKATLALSWPQGTLSKDQIDQHYYPLLRGAAERLSKLLDK
ncbi:IclR family transcriptional regulator domain-containing protein [Marinobacterium stanieri]|uniref:IclR family transcriptional regulator domain-containing protein n=1 Tax=Marinobacterium stanieri TaxID=49186 RepID=UPI0002557853|nr:IclR family transcriptional regulator C-terminal domain-containing protein [Marinobacterium stanieri]